MVHDRSLHGAGRRGIAVAGRSEGMEHLRTHDFDSLDYLTANIMLPVGGLLTCLFVGWRLDRQVLRAQLTNDGVLPFRIYRLFLVLLRYFCPVILLLVFLDNLGVF